MSDLRTWTRQVCAPGVCAQVVSGLVSQATQSAVQQPVEAATGLVMPDSSTTLPASHSLAGVSFDKLREIQGTTFVQIPKRLEEAFSDAIGVALRTYVSAQSHQEATTAWKAFLLIPYLLLFKPLESIEQDSCATLLVDRLDRFWQGDAEAMLREHMHTHSREVRSYAKAVTTNAATAKRVKTLCRAGETGRALRAADGAEKVCITADIARGLVGLFSHRVDADSMQAEVDVGASMVSRETYIAALLKTMQKSLPRLSAPGPLQMRNEHLMVVAAYVFGGWVSTSCCH